jgi:ribonuclease Z
MYMTPKPFFLHPITTYDEKIWSAVEDGYDGPVIQTQDLTVFNITKEAVVARQAKVSDQLPPIPGVPRVGYTPVQPTPPAWWAEAIIPAD